MHLYIDLRINFEPSQFMSHLMVQGFSWCLCHRCVIRFRWRPWHPASESNGGRRQAGEDMCNLLWNLWHMIKKTDPYFQMFTWFIWCIQLIFKHPHYQVTTGHLLSTSFAQQAILVLADAQDSAVSMDKSLCTTAAPQPRLQGRGEWLPHMLSCGNHGSLWGTLISP